MSEKAYRRKTARRYALFPPEEPLGEWMGWVIYPVELLGDAKHADWWLWRRCKKCGLIHEPTKPT
jgi:hypothetical protein